MSPLTTPETARTKAKLPSKKRKSECRWSFETGHDAKKCAVWLETLIASFYYIAERSNYLRKQW
jgi:hypothetical protein